MKTVSGIATRTAPGWRSLSRLVGYMIISWLVYLVGLLVNWLVGSMVGG